MEFYKILQNGPSQGKTRWEDITANIVIVNFLLQSNQPSLLKEVIDFRINLRDVKHEF